jgi:C-3',4' desaturase CrtD
MSKIAIIGSGMGSLTAGALLSNDGHEVIIIEQNYLPGGCSSSYYRQGFIFESGATTLVGLDEQMPLRFLVDKLQIDLDILELEPSMQVRLADGQILTRFKNLETWIKEAERVFGSKNQRLFWEFCYKISLFVWETSLKQPNFPPSTFKDLFSLVKNFRFNQLFLSRWGFISMEKLLKKYDLDKNELFVNFINEQLLITAQNYISEVNVLFGATAVCYTNFGNFYLWGGMIRLVKPICDFIEKKGGQILLKTTVEKVESLEKGYIIHAQNEQKIAADYVISGIPINNSLKLFNDKLLDKQYSKKLMKSEQLNSAFQMGIGFKRSDLQKGLPLHHQIHLSEPLPIVGSHSIFVSFSHELDFTRAELGQGVASVSSHVKNPEKMSDFDKKVLEQFILETLEKQQLIAKNDVIYYHSSTPKGWERWTKREWGFVGGYPQYMRVKPWQMLEARLDKKGAYICGDTTYPGQGIVGVCLSGILVYKKMKTDKLI